MPRELLYDNLKSAVAERLGTERGCLDCTEFVTVREQCIDVADVPLHRLEVDAVWTRSHAWIGAGDSRPFEPLLITS